LIVNWGEAVTANRLWLGGSDAASEGKWRWVEGPEGKEEGGDGTNYFGRLFWDSDLNTRGERGEIGVNGAYLNWDNNEPNNSPPAQFTGENALHTQVDLGRPSKNGKWNDYAENGINYVGGYLQESDPLNLKINDDDKGGHFEITKINFKRFLPSTTIDIKTISNAKDALSRVDQAIEDVIDKIAIAGSNQSRLSGELKQLQALNLETRKSISRIEDLDMARAATKLAKSELKIQSTATVFAHANELFNKRNYVKDLL